MSARRWCFTVNNYEEVDYDLLCIVLNDSSTIRYAIMGREVSDSGTPHLQGYIHFMKPTRLSGLRKLIGPRGHYEHAKGDEDSNITYCSKDGAFEEFGSRDREQGRRTDLDDFKAVVKQGTYSLKTLREEFSDICAKYPRFVSEYVRDNVPPPVLPMYGLRDWQQTLYEKLRKDPCDRKVLFVIDYEGNKGKSWFAKYYNYLHPEDSMLMRPGKHADMCYMLPPILRVLFLDCARKQVEYMPYTFMEELKDGYVGSSKYESCVKKYDKIHLVILMNQDPDPHTLSKDRYDLMYI